MTKILIIARIVWLEMLRRKDVYVLAILLVALLFGLVSINVFGLGAVTGYVKDAGLLAVWVFGWVLAVGVSARQLPQEERRGTMFSLMAKPVSRAEVIAGKWLGAWAAVGVATLCFYLVLLLAVCLHGGAFDATAFIQAYLLHLAALGIVAALTLALSTRMNADAGATMGYVLTGSAFLILPQAWQRLGNLEGVTGRLTQALYYALPHLELFDMRRRLIHDFGPAKWAYVFMVLFYGALMIALFLLLAWLGYRKKRFSREEIG